MTQMRAAVMPPAFIDECIKDLKVVAIFLTRLPVKFRGEILPEALGRALRFAPLVGLLIGLIGGAVFGLASALGLPPLVSGLLAVAATILLTGALHEDGLADVADGFGGGRDPMEKRSIMRDSRLGTYGAAALFLSILIRAAALAALGGGTAVAALVAAHTVSRALLPLAMIVSPAAAAGGLAAAAEVPAARDVGVSLALGGLIAILALGLGGALLSSLLAAAAAGLVLWLARRMIGGYTGDVLGAVQQVAEITVLLVVAGSL